MGMANDSVYGAIDLGIVFGLSDPYMVDSGQALAEVTFKVGNQTRCQLYCIRH